ncbi:MAG TPA: 4'-phosphopantetheinyl transferase superfamily protein [Proteiniclasticum sp.]|nr:4'-phosphopantetheinyl transferase superfamily protein [Proteiniclasticum sp.]
MIYTCYSDGKDLSTYDRQKEVARSLINYGLLQEYGIIAEEIVKSPLGKPGFKKERNIKLSISHCEGAVAVVISDHEVGIDVERVRSYEREAARRILTEKEWSVLSKEKENPDELFFRYWTLKESYIKALGTGLAYPLKNISIAIENDRIQSNKPWAKFYVVSNCEEYIISVCHLHSKGQEDKEMSIRSFIIP